MGGQGCYSDGPSQTGKMSYTSWSSANAEPCMWAGITPCNRTGWQLSREQLYRKGSRGHGGEVEHESTVCPCSKRVQLYTGLSIASGFGGKWFFPSIWLLWNYIWNAVCSFGPLVEDGCWHTKARLVKVTKLLGGCSSQRAKENLTELGLLSIKDDDGGAGSSYCCLISYLMGGSREGGCRAWCFPEMHKRQMGTSSNVGNSV